jgi:Xaa-Pro aminopeptidase
MKLKECKRIMRKKGVDCAVLFNMRSEVTNWNYYYFTQTNVLGILLIKSNGKDKLYVPDLDFNRAKKESIIDVYPFRDGFWNLLSNEIKNYTTIGFDYINTTLQQKKHLQSKITCKKYKDIQDIIQELKVIKEPTEIAKIIKACTITDAIFSSVLKEIKNKKLKTDSDVYAYLLYEMHKKGCIPSFDPIVAPNKAASLPHYVPLGRRLSKGFLLFDFGVRYKGYCSDMSRTIYIGKPSQKEIEIYYTLLEAQIATIKKIKPGVKVSQLDGYCRNIVGSFPHTLGHGIGVEIHEAPSVGPNSREILKEGMILTVEPGIYVLDKFGIRIEDDVLVTKNGYKVLNNSKKDLLQIS